MKRLSDYKNEEAIELWADLFDPITEMIADAETRNMIRQKAPIILKAKTLIKKHSDKVGEILLRIDPTPLDGFNVMTRLVTLLDEIGRDETIMGFFDSLPEVKKGKDTSGEPMANTEGEGNPGASSDI